MIRVLAMIPHLDMTVTTEVVDDEDQHVVTAGAIITVTLVLERTTLESVLKSDSLVSEVAEDAEDKEQDEVDMDDIVELNAEESDANAVAVAEREEDNKKKVPVWKKPEKKKKAGKKAGGGKQKQKNKAKAKGAEGAQGEQGAEAQVRKRFSTLSGFCRKPLT